MSSNKRIVIVGAGPGGLTAGMILARRGFDVTIVEKRDRVGGRNAEIRLGDFSFDTGPTFLHQKFTLDEVFEEAGRETGGYVDLVPLDPMTRLTWGELSMHTYSDRERMAAEVDRAFPGSADGFRRFMDDHAVKLRTIYPCLQRPYHQLRSYFNKTLARALPYVATRKSVVDVLARYYDDPRLQLAFTFQAKYLGMSPWTCPALFSILAYTEYRFGIYHAQGGLCRISDGMAAVFEEHGGKLRLGAEVKGLRFSGRRATGVELADGEVLECDAAVMNADYAHAATRLLGERSLPESKLERKKYSCSTFMLYLGVDREYPDEPHHHVLFADDYRRNLEEIQAGQVPSEDMSIYVRNSCVTDPRVAPAGKCGLYVLVPTTNTRGGTKCSPASRSAPG